MEIRSANKILFKWLRYCLSVLVIILASNVHAQAPVKSYTIKDGKMYIAVGKDLERKSLDSFIARYELYDLDLKNFIKTGSPDSLTKLGWKVDINNTELFVISKPLMGFDKFNDPAAKILFTQKGDLSVRFPAISNQVHFGYNRFRNKYPFGVAGDVVTFYLKGNTNARNVTLAGSFNNWQPKARPTR